MQNRQTPRDAAKVPKEVNSMLTKEVRLLTCRSWKGGRTKFENKASWNLDFKIEDEQSNASDEDSDEESLVSEGSRITSSEETSILFDEEQGVVTTSVVPPCSPPASAIHLSGDITLNRTPPGRRSTIQKQPDDCHVIL
jgi:hypothetical protein